MGENDKFNFDGKFIHIDESWLKIKELSLLQMALIVTIKGLSEKDGACCASDGYFARFLHVAENTIGNNLNKLENMGYIQRINPNTRDRKITVLDSALDRYWREECKPKNCDDPKIVVIEKEMTPKIVVDDPKNCDDRPQKLGTIIINDTYIDNIPNQREVLDNVNNINTLEPSTEPDFHNSDKWRNFSANALQMQLPVYFLTYLRSKFGACNVKLSRSDFISEIKKGVDPAVLLFAASQVYDKPGTLATTLENLGSDAVIPVDIQSEADSLVSRILTEAETNFRKSKGG